MTTIILSEINWHNLSTLTEWEVENIDEQRRKKKMDLKIKQSKVILSAWLINYSSDISKGRMQRSMAIIVASRMKNPPKNLEFLQFLPRFKAVPLLFLRNSYLSKHLITIFGNIVPLGTNTDVIKGVDCSYPDFNALLLIFSLKMHYPEAPTASNVKSDVRQWKLTWCIPLGSDSKSLIILSQMFDVNQSDVTLYLQVH